MWVIPKARAPTLFAGIHSGRDLSAYAGILGLNQGAFEAFAGEGANHENKQWKYTGGKRTGSD